MQRILEPEIMDGQVEADAYARADFADSNQWYADHFTAEYPTHLREIVDLGCGPADVPVRIARLAQQVRIVAVDGSAAMLAFARKAVEGAQLANRITLHQGRLPGLELREHHFDAVLSKDMLHHLPDPQVLWGEARRLARPGAAVYVMDLIRPDSPGAAREIVERVAGSEHPVLKEDFYNSLCAAFTVSEVRDQLHSAGLPLTVEQVTDRHMRIKGVLSG
jgi:ubiquinone/menaquinone biosynthesis C-methylase UbiE